METFQSTLSSRRATWRPHNRRGRWGYFNPRSPHGERQPPAGGRGGHKIFQSTLSSRRATAAATPAAAAPSNFNPRSPHGERLMVSAYWRMCCGFQSTLSSRRATRFLRQLPQQERISIHALLTESDVAGLPVGLFPGEFQSTLSSRRATLNNSARLRSEATFQSTLSSRRATVVSGPPLRAAAISIHALLTESDAVTPYLKLNKRIFQSTLSSRRATTLSLLHSGQE